MLKDGIFATAGIFSDQTLKEHSDYRWWVVYGGGTPELQYVALKVLSKRGSASSCERNWSEFDFI